MQGFYLVLARAMSQGDVNRAVAVLTAGLTVTIRIHLLPKSDPEQMLAQLRLDWGGLQSGLGELAPSTLCWMKWFIASYDIQKSDQNTIKDLASKKYTFSGGRPVNKSVLDSALIVRQAGLTEECMFDLLYSLEKEYKMNGLTNSHSNLQRVCMTVRKSMAEMALADRLADMEYSAPDFPSEMPSNLASGGSKGTDKTLKEGVYFVFACLKSQLDGKCLQPNEVTGDILESFCQVSMAKLCLIHFIASVVRVLPSDDKDCAY